MLLYKYRGMDQFERDLESLERNCFWASQFSKLNDPCETTITLDRFIKQSKYLLPFFGKKSNYESVKEELEKVLEFTEKIGIYSLSKTYKDELLWAHYASSHKGFCIEYDYNLLLETYNSDKRYSFPVIYKRSPPSIGFEDLLNFNNSNSIIQKMAGYKSLNWKNEKEIRIVLEEFGVHTYNYRAVKSIYFGLKMDSKHKTEIMRRLKGRGLNYYQINLIKDTYSFERNMVIDEFYIEPNYFKEISIPELINNPCKVRITSMNYDKFKKKGNIKIELDKPVDELELNWLANKIHEELFIEAKLISMIYYLKEDIHKDFAWATSHFQDGKINIKILGIE